VGFQRATAVGAGIELQQETCDPTRGRHPVSG
jgi:hypothetical protein